MNKKSAVALAVGALFAAPALAQTSTSSVQIYGRLFPQFASSKSSGATAAGTVPSNLVTNTGGDHAQRYSVDVNTSRIGFRGQEELGSGMRALWQIETRTRFDTGSGGAWADRDSFVGLRSNAFGTVRMGIIRTVYRLYGARVGMFDINPGNIVSTSDMLSGVGLDQNGTGFHVRQRNTILYETPEFGGFQAGIQYAPDESKGNPGRTIDSRLWSAAVKYTAGPLYVSAGYERHYDFFDGSLNVASGVANRTAALAPSVAGTDPRSEDTGMRLSVSYRINPQHSLEADLSRLEFTETGQGGAGRFVSYEKTTWDIGWEARWGGPWRTSLSYASANDGSCTLSGGVACSTQGLKGSQANAGVAYDFSKRTYLFALFSRLDNGASARYTTAAYTPSRGADLTQWALGVRHAF